MPPHGGLSGASERRSPLFAMERHMDRSSWFGPVSENSAVESLLEKVDHLRDPIHVPFHREKRLRRSEARKAPCGGIFVATAFPRIRTLGQ